MIFIGNTSHFYQDGLTTLAEAISILRKANYDVIMTITIDSWFARRLQERFGSDIIYIKSYETNSELAKAIGNSVASFLPYSFDAKYRRMVSTSFPSKLMEYLRWSQNIIFLSPEYSTSNILAREKKLPWVLQKNSSNLLADTIRSIIEKRLDYSSLYREVLRNEYSYDCFLDTLMDRV